MSPASPTDGPLRVREVFDAALEADPSARADVLEELCAGDEALRREVEALLAASGAGEEMLWSLAARLRTPRERAGGESEEEPLPGEVVEGRRLGAYRLLRRIGQGGMGTVYLAERDDDQFEKRVAVKVLPLGLGSDATRRRFLAERRILARLEHPGIARLLDAGVAADGTPYFVMEYVEGVPIDRYCEEHECGIEARIELFLQVCEAVEYAHTHRVVHRDLKPANILVTPGGRVKLLDFGIAKALDEHAVGEATTLTRLSGRPMTPAYASPEQLRGEAVTAATDVYALGVLLYQLLTGQPPYEVRGLSPEELERRITTREPTLPSVALRRAAEGEAVDAVPFDARRGAWRLRGDLDTIVLMALRKEPERRYPSAAALADDLVRHRKGRPVAARPDSLTYRTGRLLRRRSAAAALAALLLAGGGYAVLGSSPTDPVPAASEAALQRSIAVLPFGSLGQEGTTAFTDGIHGDVLTRLSQLADLRVISRTSVLAYRDVERPLPEIGRELGVDWILEGDVQEAGDQVRVRARLMNAREDRQVWAESFQRALTAENVFAIQEEITTRIATVLEARLSADEARTLADAPTADLEAYRLYVQGRRFLDRRTEGGMRRAVSLFEGSLDHDPSYALAWAGLADALVLLHDYGYARDGENLLPTAEEAVQRALEISPTLAEAHASLGLLHGNRRDGPAAIGELERAVELRAGYAEAHNWLSWLQMLLGNGEEALRSAARAVELDPLSSEAVSNLSLSSLIVGDAERALAEARRAGEIAPEFTTGHFYEALALYHLGRFREAAEILDGLPVAWAGSGPESTLALAYIAAGNDERGREMLREFERRGDRFSAGLVHAALGDHRRALARFREFDGWNQDWPALAVHHFFQDVLDPLRAEPAFAEIVRRIDRAWGLS